MMFGKKGGREGEIDVGSFDFLDGSQEFARFWSEPGGPLTCIIEPRADLAGARRRARQPDRRAARDRPRRECPLMPGRVAK